MIGHQHVRTGDDRLLPAGIIPIDWRGDHLLQETRTARIGIAVDHADQIDPVRFVAGTDLELDCLARSNTQAIAIPDKAHRRFPPRSTALAHLTRSVAEDRAMRKSSTARLLLSASRSTNRREIPRLRSE